MSIKTITCYNMCCRKEGRVKSCSSREVIARLKSIETQSGLKFE